MSLTLTQIEYIAREVHRQGDTALHVLFMAKAWEQAMQDKLMDLPVTPELIESWAKLVEPDKNRDGFRTGPVWVGDHQAPLAIEVRPRLLDLCRAIKDGERSADIAYYEFQRIHPFRDGNGRTGKILFCYLLNCLDAPVVPSNWFGISNP
jgi:Fic family protein